MSPLLSWRDRAHALLRKRGIGLSTNDCPTYVYVRALARHPALDSGTLRHLQRAHQLVKVGVSVDLAEREKAYRGGLGGEHNDGGVAVYAVLVEDRYSALSIEACVHRKIRHAMVESGDTAWPHAVNHVLAGGTSASLPRSSGSFGELVQSTVSLAQCVLEGARAMRSSTSTAPDPAALVLAFPDMLAQRFRPLGYLPVRMVPLPANAQATMAKTALVQSVFDHLQTVVEISGDPRHFVSLQQLSDEFEDVRVTSALIASAMVTLGAEEHRLSAYYGVDQGFRGAKIAGEPSPVEVLNAMFAFTADPADVVHHSTLRKVVSDSKVQLSRDDVREIIDATGAQWSNNAVDRQGKRSRGYTGIVVITVDTPRCIVNYCPQGRANMAELKSMFLFTANPQDIVLQTVVRRLTSHLKLSRDKVRHFLESGGAKLKSNIAVGQQGRRVRGYTGLVWVHTTEAGSIVVRNDAPIAAESLT